MNFNPIGGSVEALRREISNMFKKGIGPENVADSLYNMFYPVGWIQEWPWADLPPYGTWLWMDDRNIGDSASGATARANNDVLTLFTKIWTDYSNTTAPIYTSAGAASTRGASVADDWAAHKRISLPKRQGRTLVAMDNYGEGGSAAGAITGTWADTLGTVAGEEKHPLTAAENGPHSHNVTGVQLNTGASFFGPLSSDNTAYGTWSTAQSGSGTAHNTVQPSVSTKYIIRY